MIYRLVCKFENNIEYSFYTNKETCPTHEDWIDILRKKYVELDHTILVRLSFDVRFEPYLNSIAKLNDRKILVPILDDDNFIKKVNNWYIIEQIELI